MNIMLPINNIKYIFFDIYGTIAGFYPEREKIQQKILSQNNIFLTEAQISFGYKSADEYMANQKKIKPLRDFTQDEKKIFFSNYQNKILESNGILIDQKKLWRIWEEISNEKYELKIFDDVMENLNWLLSKGISLAGITNMDIKGEILLNNLKLDGILEFIVTSMETKSEKPNSKIFLYSINKANVQPFESVYVGDQIESDYLGSKNSGMMPVLIDRYNYYENFEGIKIKNLDEIKNLF